MQYNLFTQISHSRQDVIILTDYDNHAKPENLLIRRREYYEENEIKISDFTVNIACSGYDHFYDDVFRIG